MAYKKPTIFIAGVIALIGVGAAAAPAISQKFSGTTDFQAFGIRASDPVYPYKRQSAWKELGQGAYAVAPPRPQPAFTDYAVSYDGDRKHICAVYASTKDTAALSALKRELNQHHGQPAPTPSNGLRWTNGEGFITIEDNGGVAQVVYDFTGTCLERVRAAS